MSGALSKNLVIYHRGERRVRRVFRPFQSLLVFSGAFAVSMCSAVKFKDIAISLKNSTVPMSGMFTLENVILLLFGGAGGGIIVVLFTDLKSYFDNTKTFVAVLEAEFRENQKFRENLDPIGLNVNGFNSFIENGGYRFISRPTFDKIVQFYSLWFMYGKTEGANKKKWDSEIKKYDFDDMIKTLKKETFRRNILKNWILRK